MPLTPEKIVRFNPKTRNKALLYLTGFNLMYLNYSLIRQTTLAFRNLEVSALIMALAYFAGISFGYIRSHAFGFEKMRTWLPFFLIFQMILVTGTQLFVSFIDSILGISFAYAIVFLLVAAGSTSLYAVFLPRMIETGHLDLRQSYSAEVLGSLLGLLSLPLFSRGGMLLVLAAYFGSFLAIAWLVELRRTMLQIIFLYVVLFLVSFDYIDRSLSLRFYQRFYKGRNVEKIIYSRYSPYHKIEVARIGFNDGALILNGHWQFGPNSHANYSYFVAEYPARLLNNPSVALLGCGSMSTVGRMGDFVRSIEIVDLDTSVFDTSRRFFADYNRLSSLHNWRFISDDAKHFLGTTPEKFDLIIDDIPPARTRQVALTYTREFFELVRSRLNHGGLYSLPSLTALNFKEEYGRRILATLNNVFDQVIVLNDGGSSYYFACDRSVQFGRATLREAIDHPHKNSIRILLPNEARNLVQGETIITVNNMADLINY